MMQRRLVHLMLITSLLLIWGVGMTAAQSTPPQAPVAAVGTAFTYQGYLEKAGSAVDDSCDFRFSLWDAASGGAQIGTTQDVSGVTVDDGYFTVSGLDFGASAFAGEARYLEIAVQCTGDSAYTTLSGRVELKAAPYALYAMSAPWSGLSGVPAGFADGVDDDTTYTAGTGLDLTGTQFGIATAYRLPQSCADGQIAEWDSATGAWACGDDDTGSGGGSAWALSGNAGTDPTTNFLGTTDNQPLEVRVNNARVLRLEPNSTSPNIIGGYSGNLVGMFIYGATIGGGGTSGSINQVAADYGTIGGGRGNNVTGDAAFIGGGESNKANGGDAVVGGGYLNTADKPQSTVGGGFYNTADGTLSTVGGGSSNLAGGNYAFVGGGWHNTTAMTGTTIGGGYSNLVTATYGTIAGGYDITATGQYAAVGGGLDNIASGDWSIVGGGGYNAASGEEAVVSGGSSNEAKARYATVGGGGSNTASEEAAVVAGGKYNTASGEYAVIGGGRGNVASGIGATICGGGAQSFGPLIRSFDPNVAEGDHSTIGGGVGNYALITGTVIGGGYSNLITRTAQYGTIAGGYNITVAGEYAAVAGGINNEATGDGASIPGGHNNSAQGTDSFAAGHQAIALHDGSFVWSDSRGSAISDHSYQFLVQAYGGARFQDGSSMWVEMVYDVTRPIDTSTGAYLSSGGTWTDSSDRNLKENFVPVDSEAVLEQVAQLPVTTWNYKAEDDSVRHMGPVAQDFYAAFGLGMDDRHIAALDSSGVALAAIQGLYAQNQAQSARIEALETENAELREQVAAQQAQLDDLAARVEALEANPPLFPTKATFAPGGAWFLGFALFGLVAFGLMRRREGGER